MQAFFLEHVTDPGVVVTILVAIAGGLCTLAYLNKKALEDVIADPASRPELIAEWRQNWNGAYRDGIRAVTRFADRVYGPRLLSWRAFERSLQLAFLYPLIATILAWVLVNQHSPAGLTLFVDEPRLGSRLLRTGTLVLTLMLVVWLAGNADRLVVFVADSVSGKADAIAAQPGSLFKVSRTAVEVGVVFISVPIVGVVAIVGASAVAASGAGAGSIAAAGAFAFAIANAFGSAVAGTISVGVAVAFALMLFFGPPEFGYLVLLVYAFLPVVNAVADTVSVAITRLFLARYSDLNRPLPPLAIMIGTAVLDLLLAALCLAALLVALYEGLSLWETASPTTVPLSPGTYLADLRADWTNGFALYLMAFTTLLPTLIHMIGGFGAMITHKGRLLDHQADLLESYGPDPACPTVLQRKRMALRVWWAVFAGRALATLPILAIGGMAIVGLLQMIQP